MPKEGFTAITVSDEIEALLRERYEKNKRLLLEKYSITNFSGFLLFLTQRAEELINQDIQKQISP
jgi:hypothetical protein